MKVAEEGRKGMASRFRRRPQLKAASCRGFLPGHSARPGRCGVQLPADGKMDLLFELQLVGCDHEARQVPSYVKNHLINQHTKHSSTLRGKRPLSPGWEGAIQGRESSEARIAALV